MPRYPLARALGLLGPPPRTSSATAAEARIALALLAATHGYALVETADSDGSPGALDAALRRIEDLAVRLDADALAVDGRVDDERVEDVAAHLRLVVLRHPNTPG